MCVYCLISLVFLLLKGPEEWTEEVSRVVVPPNHPLCCPEIGGSRSNTQDLYVVPRNDSSNLTPFFDTRLVFKVTTFLRVSTKLVRLDTYVLLPVSTWWSVSFIHFPMTTTLTLGDRVGVVEVGDRTSVLQTGEPSTTWVRVLECTVTTHDVQTPSYFRFLVLPRLRSFSEPNRSSLV